MANPPVLPLEGIRVIEFSHMVMGPSVGLALADLGADVVKVEPIGGDNTRRLRGSGAGYFTMYNRNKRSIGIDLKSEEGQAVARKLLLNADVLVENFRPGAMQKLGFDYPSLAVENPRLIYCAARGFLTGPYQHRTALDEVAQMMGGLAFMTGLPDRPMRAGASVIDVMGGMFAVIGVMAALRMREVTGKGQQITSSLYESTVFLMGQHMAQQAVLGEPPRPMSIRTPAWSVYDIFTSSDAQQVFVAVVTDTQWSQFCDKFEFEELAADPTLTNNSGRVSQRPRLIAEIQRRFSSLTSDELLEKLEECGVPFAAVHTPSDLFHDPHLLASGGLLNVTIPEGKPTSLPALPLEMDGHRFGLRRDVPKQNEHAWSVLNEIGYTDDQVRALFNAGTVGKPADITEPSKIAD